MEKLFKSVFMVAVLFMYTIFFQNSSKLFAENSKNLGVDMKKDEIKKELCGKRDNKDVYLFTLTNNNGAVAELINYGGIIVALYVPDKNGKFDNVVLGLEKPNEYLTDEYFQSNPRLGALIGRYANRIKNAEFTLDGVTYNLTKNSRQKHNIHGGQVGFDRVVWDAETFSTEDGPALKLTYLCPDGHEGFPGNLKVTVIYTLTNDNSLKLDYFAETDKPTVVNFTNHCFFNLAGEGNGNILNHNFMINADKYTPSDDEGIPTGEIKNVECTPYDLRESQTLVEKMKMLPRGYDMNYILNNKPGELGLAARVVEPSSGRIMETFTTEPAMQFFSANGLNGRYKGKSGRPYESSYGFCVETQHFPNSPNEPSFPATVLRPGEKFHSVTIFKFTTQ